jgi:hypothetical protein
LHGLRSLSVAPSGQNFSGTFNLSALFCWQLEFNILFSFSQRAGAKGGVSTRYHAAATAPSGTANASPPQQCPHCAFPFQIGGPVFAEPIHHAPFVEKLIESVLSTSPELRALCPMPEPLSAPAPAPPTEPAVDGVTMVAPTVSNAALQHLAAIADLPVLVPKKPFAAAKRLLSLLSLAAQELPDAPFYYATNSLFSTLHMSTRKTSVIRYFHFFSARMFVTHRSQFNFSDVQIRPVECWISRVADACQRDGIEDQCAMRICLRHHAQFAPRAGQRFDVQSACPDYARRCHPQQSFFVCSFCLMFTSDCIANIVNTVILAQRATELHRS